MLLKKINLRKVPSEEIITEMIEDLRKKFPGLYKALIKERNEYMAKQLIRLTDEFPTKKIIAVVGAGHKESLKEMLKS